ncbi:Leucine-rich repeat and Leucine-rich repeat, typical subtype-containing protein [Strongyloides ratti]|uniref:Leucine-rich repeat and Leucine-rich repeat, typical subtype-containing protein n=1 Tax=Strongyloides ratti TaxID=34506 RepID=A0A090LUS9_STRRB|nr:Leucine-rich repeat and Leucine-rich repeat, typical subtype-containing protein [Strongyloides ratti]CEF71389.1 Leucine-rich repeat and Leucine-rich repeat, typical subtype-containing protein [Strongyloides ratti]
MEFVESLLGKSTNQSSILSTNYFTADLSERQLTDFNENSIKTIHPDLTIECIEALNLSRNLFETIPLNVFKFIHLQKLEVCELSLTTIPEQITNLQHLRHLDARNNLIRSIPKYLSKIKSLEEINFSGNELTQFPDVFFNLPNLNTLNLGENKISTIPQTIYQIKNLKVFYLGGNQLKVIPDTIGLLHQLTCLVVSDNQLSTVPQSIASLRNLKRLSLHNNLIRTLPPQILNLTSLESLSLRNNPLVRKFVDNLMLTPPSLKEIAARIVRKKVDMKMAEEILPYDLIKYLNSAHECLNPHCTGVYFETCFENIKFVDFCGMYKVPFLQYLCSPNCGCGCSDYGPHVCRNHLTDARMKKVLLG